MKRRRFSLDIITSLPGICRKLSIWQRATRNSNIAARQELKYARLKQRKNLQTMSILTKPEQIEKGHPLTMKMAFNNKTTFCSSLPTLSPIACSDGEPECQDRSNFTPNAGRKRKK